MLATEGKIRFGGVLIGAVLLAAAVSACGISVAEDGPHEVRSRGVTAFSRIEVRGSTAVTVEHGRRPSLRLEGGANRIHDLKTFVDGGTLVVEGEDSSGTIDVGGDPARVVARIPRVEAVEIDGSGEVVLRDVREPRLETSIHGSGEVRADGWTGRLRARVDGSGSLRLAALRAEDAAVAISGSGSAELGRTARLDATIDGSGGVSYAGDPHITEEISGSGRLERR